MLGAEPPFRLLRASGHLGLHDLDRLNSHSEGDRSKLDGWSSQVGEFHRPFRYSKGRSSDLNSQDLQCVELRRAALHHAK